jgi:hypothetical protein
MLDLTAVSKLIEQAGPEEAGSLFVVLSTLRAQAQARMLRGRGPGGVDNGSRLLTRKQAASLRGISLDVIDEMRRSGLPWIQIGKRGVRIPEDGLARWDHEHTR